MLLVQTASKLNQRAGNMGVRRAALRDSPRAKPSVDALWWVTKGGRQGVLLNGDGTWRVGGMKL